MYTYYVDDDKFSTGEEKFSLTISDNSMRPYYDISSMRGPIFFGIGLIRKLICGLHKENVFKF